MPLGFKKNFRHQPVAKLFLANLVNCKHKCQRPFPYVLSNKTFRESVGYSLLCNMFVKQRVLYTEREIVVSNWCWNKVAATNIPRVILELMLCGNHLVSSFGVGHQQVTKICPTPRCSQPTVRVTGFSLSPSRRGSHPFVFFSFLPTPQPSMTEVDRLNPRFEKRCEWALTVLWLVFVRCIRFRFDCEAFFFDVFHFEFELATNEPARRIE